MSVKSTREVVAVLLLMAVQPSVPVVGHSEEVALARYSNPVRPAMSTGGVQLRRPRALPISTYTSVGAEGTPLGVAVASSEAGPGSPYRFTPRTRKVCSVFPASPVTVWRASVRNVLVHGP